MNNSMLTDVSTTQNQSRPAVALAEDSLVGVPGFFRVGRSAAGRWWLVRPDGTPMFYRGVCALWMPDDYKGLEAGEFTSPLLREVNARLERIAFGEITPKTLEDSP